MALKLTNNATSTLAGSINAAAVTLSVQSGDASKFPTLGGGDWCPATLVDSLGNREVVKVTARSGADLTIVRGQEGTVARDWNSGDRVDVRMTVAALAALETPDAIHGATAKTTLAGADEFSLWDSVATAFRKITSTNLVTAIGLAFASLTAKTSLVDADVLHLNDSAATNAPKAISWANFKATLFTALGALIAAATAKTSPVDADGVAIADSGASNATKVVTLTNLWTNYLKGKADALYAALSNVATSANFLANVADKFLDTDGVWGAAAWVNLGATLTGNLTLTFSTFINAYGTATGNITFNAVAALKDQSGVIQITASGGDRTVSFNTTYFATPNNVSLGTITSGTTVAFSYYRAQSGKIVLIRLGTV